MKLTPLDIQQMVFKARWRGYDRQELREKLGQAEDQLTDLKKAEATLTHTLVSTQALTDELKQAARRDAELIMKEAEMKAGTMLQEARQELAALQRDILDLQKQRLVVIERLRATLRTFERVLEIEEGDQDQSDPPQQTARIVGGSSR
jgi:cell division initiation protein